VWNLKTNNSSSAVTCQKEQKHITSTRNSLSSGRELTHYKACAT